MFAAWILDHLVELNFVIASVGAIWVAFDARKNRVPVDGKPYGWNNGAVAWFLSTIVFSFWLVGYYLWKRHQVLKERAELRDQDPPPLPRQQDPPDRRRPS